MDVSGPDGVGYAFGVPLGQPTRVESPLTGYAHAPTGHPADNIVRPAEPVISCMMGA
jgi:hypothetical protein